MCYVYQKEYLARAVKGGDLRSSADSAWVRIPQILYFSTLIKLSFLNYMFSCHHLAAIPSLLALFQFPQATFLNRPDWLDASHLLLFFIFLTRSRTTSAGSDLYLLLSLPIHLLRFSFFWKYRLYHQSNGRRIHVHRNLGFHLRFWGLCGGFKWRSKHRKFFRSQVLPRFSLFLFLFWGLIFRVPFWDAIFRILPPSQELLIFLYWLRLPVQSYILVFLQSVIFVDFSTIWCFLLDYRYLK